MWNIEDIRKLKSKGDEKAVWIQFDKVYDPLSDGIRAAEGGYELLSRHTLVLPFRLANIPCHPELDSGSYQLGV